MSDFIHNKLNPWYAWASTLGPCQQDGNATVHWGFTYLDAYDYTGKVDNDGKACSFGTASGNQHGGITQILTGTTFFKNKVHGLANVYFPFYNPTQHTIYEVRDGFVHGKVTAHFGDGTIENRLFSKGAIAKKNVSASEAFYNIDGTVGTALDSNWQDYVDEI